MSGAATATSSKKRRKSSASFPKFFTTSTRRKKSMAVLRMFIISPLMRARDSRRAFSFHTFPLSPFVDRLFSLPFLSFHSLGVSYFLPYLSLFRPAVHDRPPIFAVNHVRSTFR